MNNSQLVINNREVVMLLMHFNPVLFNEDSNNSNTNVAEIYFWVGIYKIVWLLILD